MPQRKSKKFSEQKRLDKIKKSVRDRQEVQKAKLIEKLSEQPNVSIASRLANVPRANFYRWIKEDQDFKNKVSEAFELGIEQINDLAEMKLIQRIKDNDFNAIKYWLIHNNHRFGQAPIPKILNVFDEMTIERKKEISEAIQSFLGLIDRSAKGEDLREVLKRKN